MKKLIHAVILFAAVIIAVSGFSYIQSADNTDNTGSYAVDLNEIENLCRHGDTDSAAAKAKELRQEIRSEKREKSGQNAILLMGGISLAFLAGVSLYCGIVMIRPFRKLSDFAENVAKGDLDIPLEYQRTNYFGKFTWAFDSMRSEIRKARACQKEAIENHKTVIASLSHDIKTPIASIRAYTEALELGIGSSPEKCAKYTEVIIRKCDEVSKLTSDMLTHSLTELGKLKMSPQHLELGELLEKAVADISPDGKVHFHKPSYPINIYADPERLRQAAENLINNAAKYAGTELDITAECSDGQAVIRFRDYGKGIPDEDMPFIFGKFCRGSNTDGESGAGLGLFIVKYIAEQSGGSVRAENLHGGFQVTLTLPVDEEKS